MPGIELTFSINSYNRPDIRHDSDADALRIVRCLFRSKPNSLGGESGFNISKYSFESIDDYSITLANEIKVHISKILPDIIVDDVEVVKLDHRTIGIGVSIHGQTEESKKKFLFKMEENLQLKNHINLSEIVKIGGN